jgi:plasmid maintenance system antidote protein VapI
MAARNFTGSAGIRSSKTNLRPQNTTLKLAEMAARMNEIRAVVVAAIESLRGQNVRIDADVAANLQRFAVVPLAELAVDLHALPIATEDKGATRSSRRQPAKTTKAFGQILTELCVSQKVTAATLASRASVHLKRLNAILAGSSEPYIEEVFRIAAALDTKASELIRRFERLESASRPASAKLQNERCE